MTIKGALNDLNKLIEADDIPFYYKPMIKSIIDTIMLEQESCEVERISIGALRQDERIHHNPVPELQGLFDFIENKLGIRLYTWQKTYIAYGTYRQSGLTTAKILRLLFNPCHKRVIDLTGFPRSPELKFERDEMIRIYKELKDQRIAITRCLLTKEDKKAYLDQGGSHDNIVDYNSVL